MTNSNPYVRAILGAWFVHSVAMLNGCGNTPNGAATNTVAARCTTAEDVVAQFNEMSGSELVNVSGLVMLFHPENEWQERLLESMIAALPIYELDAVMRAEYNTPYQSTPLDAFLTSPFKPAKLIESDESRGVAMFTDSSPKAQRLLLIKNNGSWWISAVTLEQDAGIKKAFDASTLLGMTGDRQALCIAAPGIIQRIKAGDFYSAKNAMQAIQEAVPNR